MSQSNEEAIRMNEQEMEAIRRSFNNEHGRYIALMDLSHFLSNENVEALLPAAEVVLNRPLTGPMNPSMVELPTTSRTLDIENLAPPAPPLPRMMKNLLKDRRRLQRQFVSSTTPQIPEFDSEVVFAAHKALENYQLKEPLRSTTKDRISMSRKKFSKELMFASLACRDLEGVKFLKDEVKFGAQG